MGAELAVSPSADGLGEGAAIDSGIESVADSGGGSMNDEGVCGTIGSGSSGISSLAEAVSMVIWFVGLVVERKVYRIGEHLTATEGFL